MSPTVRLSATNLKWYIFKYFGKVIYVPSQALALESFKGIYLRGGVYGTGEISGTEYFDDTTGITPRIQDLSVTAKDRNNYKIRLMTGIPEDYSGVLVTNTPNFVPKTEFDLFVLNIYTMSNANKQSVYLEDLKIPEADKSPWRSFTGSTRSWGLMQGGKGTPSSPRAVTRGRFDSLFNPGSNPFVYTQLDASNISYNTQSVWWPVLEQI